MRDFFLNMDGLVFEGSEFDSNLDSGEAKDPDIIAVEFSSKLLKAFDRKVENYNTLQTNNTTTCEEIKNVYIQSTSSCPQKYTDQINSWSLAKVNMFLRLKSGEYFNKEKVDNTPLLKEISCLEFENCSNLESFAQVDIMENLSPSAEDFLQASEDIKEYGLDYSFKNMTGVRQKR